MRQSARRERKSSSRGDGICSWFFALLTFALGVVLLLCGMPNAAYADEDQDPAENAVRVAEDLLNSVLNRPDFQNSFVFSADRDSSYWLGEPLNTYIEANGEYSQTNLVVWPVFAGQDIVASVVEMRDLESGSTYRFSTANSEDIDAFFKKEEKGAIVLRGSSACLVSNDAEGGDVDELIDAAPLIESLGRQKAYTTKCTVSYTKQVVKEPIYPCRELVARDGGGDDWFTWVEIDVPRFRQRSWNTC